MSKRSIAGMLFMLAATASAQQKSITNRADLNIFTRNYYLHPQPELVTQAMSVLVSSGFLDNANAVPPTVAFFAEIFGGNPERVPAWKDTIAKLDTKSREVLDAAMEIGNAPGVLAFTDQAPWMNDMCWGAFFASGRKELLDRLIETTALWDERNDKMLFLTGATALWSLSGNARTHEKVRQALEAAKVGADARKVARLDLALTSVSSVLDQMRAVMKEQADAGKW